MATEYATEIEATPYQLIGGNEAAVRRLVDRFYDLMDSAPEARDLRAMHAGDLAPMRDKLTWFLTGWLGGPALYARHNRGSVCITEAHCPFPIDATARDQWMWCMRRAMDETGAPNEFRQMIDAPLTRVAEFLRNR